jgi:hypothetical protein
MLGGVIAPPPLPPVPPWSPQVLKKTPASKSIDEAHELEINAGYKNPSKVRWDQGQGD